MSILWVNMTGNKCFPLTYFWMNMTGNTCFPLTYFWVNMTGNTFLILTYCLRRWQETLFHWLIFLWMFQKTYIFHWFLFWAKMKRNTFLIGLLFSKCDRKRFLWLICYWRRQETLFKLGLFLSEGARKHFSLPILRKDHRQQFSPRLIFFRKGYMIYRIEICFSLTYSFNKCDIMQPKSSIPIEWKETLKQYSLMPKNIPSGNIIKINNKVKAIEKVTCKEYYLHLINIMCIIHHQLKMV